MVNLTVTYYQKVIHLKQTSKHYLGDLTCSVCGHDKVKKGDMLRCYYCERFYYDMHPEWIDHVLDREKDDEEKDDEGISAYSHVRRKTQE